MADGSFHGLFVWRQLCCCLGRTFSVHTNTRVLQQVLPAATCWLHLPPPRSPGRMGRLLRVVRAALPASEEQPGGPSGAALATTAGAAGQELWRQHAEYEGAVRVLTWGGIGYSSASWCPRYGVLYQVGREGGSSVLHQLPRGAPCLLALHAAGCLIVRPAQP